jgi:poly(3-hydroxybutyrate) depolymerase
LQQCKNQTAVPYIQIHAKNDQVVPFESGPARGFGGGQEAVDQAIEKNQCHPEFIVADSKDYLKLIAGQDTVRMQWSMCQSGADVEFWQIQDANALNHNPHVPFFNEAWVTDILDSLFRF